MLFCCVPTAGMLHAEELLWGVIPIPGAFNVRDGEVVDGVLFEVMQLLAEQLPELHMRYDILPITRVAQRMAEKSDMCSSGLLQMAERDQVGYFVPYVVSTPIHVLVRRQTVEQLLIEDGQVSLEWLFANPYLRGALANGRIYPEPIRERLLKAHVDGHLPELGGSLAGENLLLMVSHHRLDYVFDYPVIYTEVMRHLNLSDDLVSLPLKESAELVSVGIYCSRTAWGAGMAKRLDQAIRELSTRPDNAMRIYQRWLPPEVFAHYRKDLLAFFAQRASAGPLLLN